MVYDFLAPHPCDWTKQSEMISLPRLWMSNCPSSCVHTFVQISMHSVSVPSSTSVDSRSLVNAPMKEEDLLSGGWVVGSECSPTVLNLQKGKSRWEMQSSNNFSPLHVCIYLVMWLYSCFQQQVEFTFPLLDSGLLWDFLWPIGQGEYGAMLILNLGLKDKIRGVSWLLVWFYLLSLNPDSFHRNKAQLVLNEGHVA